MRKIISNCRAAHNNHTKHDQIICVKGKKGKQLFALLLWPIHILIRFALRFNCSYKLTLRPPIALLDIFQVLLQLLYGKGFDNHSIIKPKYIQSHSFSCEQNRLHLSNSNVFKNNGFSKSLIYQI